MKITLFAYWTFHTLLLPDKCAGQYWVCARDSAGKIRRIAAVEGLRATGDHDSGQWILKSNSQYQILDETGAPVSKMVLEPLKLYAIQSADGIAEYRLYTEPLSEDRRVYRALKLQSENVVLELGRSERSDIRYDSSYVSGHHATLRFSRDSIALKDNSSRNHTFVNGRSVETAQLKAGDVIYIMGMQIVVTNRFLYINDPDGRVSIQSTWLREHHVPPFLMDQSDPEEPLDPVESEDFYYRAPRFKQDVDPLEIRLDAPPTANKSDETPILMSVGPAVTMGMASATTAVFSVINAVGSGNITSSIPSIVMSLGMLCGTLLWPTLTKAYQKKANQQKEDARQKTYSEYLHKQEQRIQAATIQQGKILRENDRSPADYMKKIVTQPLQIWERTPKHTDFLRLRLGTGRLPLNLHIQYPERKFAVEQDVLLEAMYQFGEQERWLEDVPICLSLTERFVSGIYADRQQLINYAKSLILQLTVLHSYDEVKLVVLYDESDAADFSFVRWLPHTMDNEQRVRYIATTAEEAQALSSDLEPIIEYRKALNPEQLEEEAPYFVVLCLDKRLSARAEFLRSLLESRENIRFSVVSLYERLKDLPKECSAVVELGSNDQGSLVLINDECDAPIPFRTDVPDHLDLREATEILANTALDVSNAAFQLPRKYTFLEMMDVGMVEHLNLTENWTANDPTKSLAAPIGIDPNGDLFCLDIHQRAHGPHGLIAGMTGSGKSETIISYILSLAIHYHPYEVAFILIDYKGGGMAKAFENIPHTAGIITNLDGNAINRSLMSMQSELHRRELIFQKVSKQYGISNIDIYKYQKLYREGKVSEPLPHLIIISDEFAELKQDQPDFMAALTSTARVGRSLGVHLILATQKPGGVVDDQIRSNSRFRLCLKVQDRGDSTEMMGRPEAAALVDTGRFYLQVGNNEVFKLGQSAWAGASYHPSARTVKEPDDAVSVINTNGQVIAEANTDRYANAKDARKQLDVITEYISKVSQEEHLHRWKMWLDPIPARIYVDDLAAKYPSVSSRFVLNPIVGEYDDPAHQSQGILRVPISESGNAIVYGSAGSGKTLFLEAMAYSLLRDHTPEEVNLYILDFGSETMPVFRGAPHVGDVVLSHEKEKVTNLFKLLRGKLENRKKLLSRFGGSLEQYNAQSQKPEPGIVVMISNYANFTELYDGLSEDLGYLTREGTRYGIYFVLSCAGVNNVKFSLQQNFKSMYCLQMNNTADYSVIVGKTGGLTPARTEGRGMVRLDRDSVLEFQTARLVSDESPYGFLQSFCRSLSVRYAGMQAPGVPVLPETVSVDYLARYTAAGNLSAVPVGVEKETLAIARMDLTAQSIYPVFSPGQEWRAYTDALACLLADKCDTDTLLLAPGGWSGSTVGDKLRVCSDRSACVAAVYDIFRQVLVRNNSYKEALAAGTAPPEFTPLVVIIQSIAQLKDLLDSHTVEVKEASDDTPINRLSTAMAKCAKEYGIYFILAESLQALTPFTGEKWYKAWVSGNNGTWLGNGISSQYRLNISRKLPSFNAPVGNSFGFLVTNTEAVCVKFLQ